MPVIVIHTEPTHEAALIPAWSDGALQYIVSFPLLVALVFALFLKRRI